MKGRASASVIKVVFLLPALGAPKSNKRIEAMMKHGVEAKILAFDRTYYPGSPLPAEYDCLGTIREGRYFLRFFVILRAFRKARLASTDADAIYAFGLDMLLLAWLARFGTHKPLKLIYEVADVREILLDSGLLSRFLRWLERFLLKRTALLVVTSDSFVREYYVALQGMTDLRYLTIENKLNGDSFPRGTPSGCTPPKQGLRIGYFGFIRCERSLEILRLAAERGRGKIKVYIRGVPLGVKGLEDQVLNHPYISYGGPYVSPDDLAEIYSNVDLVWIVAKYHEGKAGNLTWARSNRFYEACWFRKPMVAQTQTEDGLVVQKLNLGTVIDLSDVNKSAKRLLQITVADLECWAANISRLPSQIYLYTDEHKQLVSNIMKFDD